MEIKFMNPGFEYSVESIMLFQNGDTGDYWRDSLFAAYPQLERTEFDTLDSRDRVLYLQNKLYEVYKIEEKSILEKVSRYNDYWKQNREEITDAFSKIFSIDYSDCFNDIIGKITLNPVCPRFLDTHTFDVFYQYSEKGALGTAIHEAIHFLWFDVWQKRFCDNAIEYETPNLKWVFSEAAIDAITRNEKRFCEKYPYTDYAYRYFYKMEVDGSPILEKLNEIYVNSDIIQFMEKGYELFTIHETGIRKQMR